MAISKRDLLSRAIGASQLPFLLEHLPLGRGLLALNYHRIGNSQGNPFDDGVFSASAEMFRRQVAYLKRHYRILTLEECRDAAEADQDFDEPSALITFDDGYRDNYELAFPILREAGAPATFFVTTGFVVEHRMSWWDRIAYILKKTSRERIVLNYPRAVDMEFGAGSRESAIRAVLRAYKSAPEVDDQRFFRELEEYAGVQVDEGSLGRELFMTSEHIREMKRAGMSIGSHTHSHPILGRLSESEQYQELSTSKRILEGTIGDAIDSIAYPVGSMQAFNDTTRSVARSLGYKLGFSFYGGINRPKISDRFSVLRTGIDEELQFHRFRSRSLFLRVFGRSWV